jgi:hypothetical protein
MFCWSRDVNILFRFGLTQFLVGVGLSRASCWAFAVFVGAVITGVNFVELARLKLCVGVVLSGSPVGLSHFLYVWAEQGDNALLSSHG